MGEILSDVSKDPELHRIWRKGFLNGENLNEEDQEKLGIIFYRIFWSLDSGHHSSWLDPGIDGYVKTMLDIHLKSPVVQAWWSRNRRMQTEPFRTIVDANLEKIVKETEAHEKSA